MSKKVKGSSAKKPTKKAAKKPAAKKSAPKKQVKKVTKSVTKAAPKKVTPKKVSNSKKVVPKKVVKKAVKPAPKKTIKKIIVAKKSATTPAKASLVKKPVKKATPTSSKLNKVKKVVKPSVPISSNKKVTKPEVKKTITIPKKETVAIKPNAVKKVEKVIQKQVTVEKKVKPVAEKIKEETTSTKSGTGKKEVINNGPEVLAITNVIPKVEKVELSASKIASITSSITNPVKKVEAYAVKPEKEPNGKFEMEYITRASAEMLYEFLATPSGLSEWFCDDVNIRNGIFTFIWDGQMQQARLLKTIDEHLVRFQWVDKTDGSFFEFRIQRDDLTNDISLIITDFADSKGDQESAKLLWNNQVDKLMHVLGSVY